MTHKANCILFCKEYLNERGLSNIFNLADFEHYYRKNNGAQKNAFSTGINAADFIIYQKQLLISKINHNGTQLKF